MVGSHGCGKTSLLQLLLQKDVHDTKPTLHPETSTTHCEYKVKLSEKDEKGEDMVVHYIFTEFPRDVIDKEEFKLLLSTSTNKDILVVFCFDTEQSLLDAIQVEEALLNDDIARVFLVSKQGKADEERRHSLMESAQEHCTKFGFRIPTFY